MAYPAEQPKLIPLSVDEPKHPDPEITVSEAEAAAQEAGLSVIRIRKLRGSSQLGKFIEQLGAQKIGRTTLVIAQEFIESGIQQCDDFIAKADPNTMGPELVVDVIKLKQAFTDLMIKAGVAQMKSDEKSSSVAAAAQSLNIPFPPGSQVAVKTADENKTT